jgi:hypothetical protein
MAAREICPINQKILCRLLLPNKRILAFCLPALRCKVACGVDEERAYSYGQK